MAPPSDDEILESLDRSMLDDESPTPDPDNQE